MDESETERTCVVEVNSRVISAGDEPPDRYAHEYEGSLRLLDENYEPGVTIGQFLATVLDVESAVNERQSILDVFDRTSETLGYFEALYEEDGSFQKPVMRLLYGENYGMWEPNALILQRLVICREHRGFGYGLQALQALIEEFRVGVGLIAMKPFPLQFEGSVRARRNRETTPYQLDAFSGRFRSARTKLRRYYGRLGFKLVPKTDYMVMSVDSTARWSSRT